MATNDIFLLKMNANGDWVQHALTAEANKVIGFDASMNPVMVTPAKAHSYASGTQTSLTLDLATNNIFMVELSANTSFSVSNYEVGRDYYFHVKNTGASAITITLPNTADIVEKATETITAAKTRVFAMQWNGTKRTWFISAELT